MTFYESLVSKAKENEQGEKPIFLLAILKYVLKNDELQGIPLLKLLHTDSIDKFRKNFDKLATGRRPQPERSWDNVATKREMYDQIQTFKIERKADVSTAFANLTIDEIEELVGTLQKRLERKSKTS